MYKWWCCRESPLATLLFLAGNDVNKDGLITLEEADDHWAAKDADENGLVSLDELRSWAENYIPEFKDTFDGKPMELVKDLIYINKVGCDDVNAWISGLEGALG